MAKEEGQAMEGEQNTENPRNRTRVSMARPPPLSPPPCSPCPAKSAQAGHKDAARIHWVPSALL